MTEKFLEVVGNKSSIASGSEDEQIISQIVELLSL